MSKVAPSSFPIDGVPGLLEEVDSSVMLKGPIGLEVLVEVPEGAVAFTSVAKGGLFTVLAQISRSARAGVAIPMARIPTIAAMAKVRK